MHAAASGVRRLTSRQLNLEGWEGCESRSPAWIGGLWKYSHQAVSCRPKITDHTYPLKQEIVPLTGSEADDEDIPSR
jgi:hypothetical protein